MASQHHPRNHQKIPLRENRYQGGVMFKNNRSLFLTCVIVYLLFYSLTVIDMEWLTSLLSRDLRLILIPFIFYFGMKIKDKTFWLFAVLISLNIPSDFADIIFVDRFDFGLGTIKTILAIALGLLVIAEICKRKK